MALPTFDPEIIDAYRRNGALGAMGAGLRTAGSRVAQAARAGVQNLIVGPSDALESGLRGPLPAFEPPNIAPVTAPAQTQMQPTPYAASVRNAVNGPTTNPNGISLVTAPQIPPPEGPPPIRRVDRPGQSPLFTNQPESTDDAFFARRGPGNALPSVPGFLNNVRADTGAFGGTTSEGGGGGGGLGLPGVSNQNLADIARGAREGIQNSGNNIVAGWQGRQLSRLYARLTGSAAELQNAGSTARGVGVAEARQRDEVPIANLNARVAARGQDFGLAPHLPQLRLDNAAANAVDEGDYDTANAIGTIGKFAPLPRNPVLPHQAQPDGLGGYIQTLPSGQTIHKSAAQLAQEEAVANSLAAREAAARTIKANR